MSWFVRVENASASTRWSSWREIVRPRYPFHSAVAKQYGDELPLGDHVVEVREDDGAAILFRITNVVTTYARPL